MAITKTIENLAESLAGGNQIYTDNVQRWEYMLQSYIGGESYRDGNHLTKYMLETAGEYNYRLNAAHLENHCASVVSVYNSFLFREKPYRELYGLEQLPETQAFMRDADMDGSSFNSVMKDVATWSSVFGHAWIMVVKPDVGAVTRAEEMTYGARPYLTLLTPLTVLDWEYARKSNGAYSLDYFKYIEDVNGDVSVIKEWTPEVIRTSEVYEDADGKQRAEVIEETVNGLGYIPAVCAYNKKSTVRGIGVSDLNDIADTQKFIYNMLQELEQTIRLDSHPSLVTTPDVIAGNGAGSIIQISESTDPALKPYILDYNGASVSSILDSIAHAVESIDKMANVGAVRASESRKMSGVAMQTEFQLLNARLSEKANNLALAEEQIFEIFADYMGRPYDCVIEYPDSFNINDTQNEYAQLESANRATENPQVKALIDRSIVELLGYDPDEILGS